MSNNALTALVLAALDDSGLKALEERVTELAEIGFKPVIVDELPETGEENTLYLVPQQDPGEDPWYKEYMWLDNQWELIGTTSVDFSDYYTSNDVDNILENYYTQSEADDKFVVREVQGSGITSRLTNDGSIISEVTNSDNSTTVEVYTDNVRIEADDLTDGSWSAITVDADGGINMGAGDNDNTSEITINPSEGTIVLDAPNGVQVPEPVNDNDAATKSYVDSVGDNIQTDITNLENEVTAHKNKFFDGVSEDWDQFTTEEKVYKLVSAVEDYVTLDIAETYSINAAVGLDPQDEIISDMYEDEIIDMTNEIIGGNG